MHRAQRDHQVHRHHQTVQPPRTRRGGQSGHYLRRYSIQGDRRTPATQRTACPLKPRGYLPLRLAGCHRSRGHPKLLRPRQARAVLHRFAPRDDQAPLGGGHPASGLKSVAAGSSDIFRYPRLASTAKGMKVRRSCQPHSASAPAPSPSAGLGLGRIYDQGRRGIVTNSRRPSSIGPRRMKFSWILRSPGIAVATKVEFSVRH